MTTIPKPTAMGSSYTAKYDAWNRLVELDGEASYEYDGLHRRIVRTEDSTTRHFYYNEKWQCLEERATESGSAQRQYVWHPYYIDALAVTYDDQGTKHFYCHDANFNITLALDSSGNPVERYHYSPYGEVKFLKPDFTTRSDSSIENEHLYTGRRTDPVTGLQLNRHRYYHAKLGRWVTRDPIGYRGGWNLYEYVFSNSIDLLDPFGQDVWVENTPQVGGLHKRICVDVYDSECNKTGKYCISFGVDGNGSFGCSCGGASKGDGGNKKGPGIPGIIDNPNGNGIVFPDNEDPATHEQQCDSPILSDSGGP